VGSGPLQVTILSQVTLVLLAAGVVVLGCAPTLILNLIQDAVQFARF
jgi:hypothetical protein